MILLYEALMVTAIFLVILCFFSLYMAYHGPGAADRIIAINVISTKVAVLIAILAIVTNQDTFIDVSLIYAMMGFVATVCVSKYLEKGKLF